MAKTKAPPPPPEFSLTALNPAAPGVIRMWCVRSQMSGHAGLDEVNEAYAVAAEMEEWFKKYGAKK